MNTMHEGARRAAAARGGARGYPGRVTMPEPRRPGHAVRELGVAARRNGHQIRAGGVVRERVRPAAKRAEAALGRERGPSAPLQTTPDEGRSRLCAGGEGLGTVTALRPSNTSLTCSFKRARAHATPRRRGNVARRRCPTAATAGRAHHCGRRLSHGDEAGAMGQWSRDRGGPKAAKPRGARAERRAVAAVLRAR